ncbi:MAG: hypothetical protein FD155_1369 [Bacteroidetes bacterium]|nr:MAG: hypothetical protein FD155_1369 [Bacteroidota bacterium]
MKYFDEKTTLYDITEQYPETLKVFIANGFTQLSDETKRNTFGKALQLGIALTMRQLDLDAFVNLLEETIENGKLTSDNQKANGSSVKIKGLLPCPVRIPMQENLDNYFNELRAKGITVQTDLKSASMGLDWIKEEVLAATSSNELDDIYLSAGFDIFFEDAYFGRFIKKGEFGNPLNWNSINPIFMNSDLQLDDLQGRYGMIAVVPAVFLVNTAILGDRPIPQSWEELLDPIYERSVSLPVSDFDLFNAILLTLDKTYGRKAITALGKNMLQSMHPAQMVKSERLKENRPAITIMPNFFTKMVKEGSAMKAVWPKDGAIISPIFMIGKSMQKDYQNAVCEFIGSKSVAEILAHQGLFPSLHPEVDNRLPEGTKFMWLGWDYISSHNLNQEFEACRLAFETI